METITFSMDGKIVTAPVTASILDAADRNGIFIPRLCHHPELKPAGACRLCLVEDEKTARLMAACVTPVASGQSILTRTERVMTHRRNIVRLMMAEHPESCLVCGKGNRCALRGVAARLGIGEADLYPMQNFKRYEQANPFITRDLSKCILCGKCIRADQELVVVGAIDYAHRGFKSRPSTLHDTGLELSSCTFCGTCVSICPTGALGTRYADYAGTPEREAETVCGFCPVGCRLSMGVAGGKIVEVNPSSCKDTVNKATLCVRGHFAHDFLNSDRRLTTPLIRKRENGMDESPVPASWEVALEHAADGLLRVKSANGSQSIGFFGSSRCTNEENYLFQKIARTLLHTNHIDNGGYLSGHPLLSEFDEKTNGRHRRNPLANLETAEVILVLGADPTRSTPVAGYHLKRAAKNGIPLALVDPRITDLSSFASLQLRIPPMSDLDLLNGILAFLLDSNGYDRTFIDMHTEGFSILRYGLSSLDLAAICRSCGVNKEAIANTAALLKGKKISVVLGRGILAQRNARHVMDALINLLLLTGSLGSDKAGVYLLSGENNAMGAFDMGTARGVLPGRQKLGDEASRQKWETVWHASIPSAPGMNLVQMIKAAEQGLLKGLYIMGENPLRALPEPKRVRAALEKLDFLVVQDILDGETVRLANVVLPGAAFCEKAGSFTNLEGRVQVVSPVVPPPGNAKPDWEILDLLQSMLGADHRFGSAESIRQEIHRFIPLYPDELTGGQGWLKNEGSGGARQGPVSFKPVVTAGKQPSAAENYRFTAILCPGRHHAGSGTRTGASQRLTEVPSPEGMELSSEDADFLQVNTGAAVTVSSPFGEVTRTVTLSNRVSRGEVFIPTDCKENAFQALCGLSDPEEAPFSGWITLPVRVSKKESHEPSGH